jgi:hypothetical protein
MMDMRINYFIISFALALVLIPSFAIVSSSQSNSTLPSDSLSNSTLSNASISDEADEDIPFNENETSFASLSRSLAETNQSDDEQTSLPPSTESESDDEQTSLPPSTESESEGETNEEEDIQ